MLMQDQCGKCMTIHGELINTADNPEFFQKIITGDKT
jgi:hypothetical protein